MARSMFDAAVRDGERRADALIARATGTAVLTDVEMFEATTLFHLKNAIRDAHEAVRAQNDNKGMTQLWKALMELDLDMSAVTQLAASKVNELDS